MKRQDHRRLPAGRWREAAWCGLGNGRMAGQLGRATHLTHAYDSFVHGSTLRPTEIPLLLEGIGGGLGSFKQLSS